jgi:hypothetical protein
VGIGDSGDFVSFASKYVEPSRPGPSIHDGVEVVID